MFIVHVKKSRIDPLIGVRVWETVTTQDVDDLFDAYKLADQLFESNKGDHVSVSEKIAGRAPMGRYARYVMYEGKD